MAILVNKDTRVLVQGITGRVGSFQTKIMLDYGTKIVAGVTPGKGGTYVHNIPVYDLIQEAADEHDVDVALSFVPGRYAADAAFEAIEAGVDLEVILAAEIPNIDFMKVTKFADEQGVLILGPDTAGLISPGKSKVGVHPNRMFTEGNVGVISKSGALSYESCKVLTEHGVGQSTVVGIGGGPLWGLTQTDVLEMFEEDEETDVVVFLGEIGGTMEETAAEYIRKRMRKPVVALIVGRNVPKGKRMGHAGAIIQRGKGAAADKIKALKDAEALIARSPEEIPRLISSIRKG